MSSLVLLRRRVGWAVKRRQHEAPPRAEARRKPAGLAGAGHSDPASFRHTRHAGLTPGARVGVMDATLDMSQADLAHPSVNLGSESDMLTVLPTYVQLPRETRESALAVHERQNLLGKLVGPFDDDHLAGLVPSDNLTCQLTLVNGSLRGGTLLGPLKRVSDFHPFAC